MKKRFIPTLIALIILVVLAVYSNYYEVDDVTDILNGKDVEIDSQYQLLFLTHKGKIIAAYEKADGNIYRCKRGLW